MLAALTANAVRGAFYPLLLARRGSLVPKGAWVELTLDGPVTELERPLRRLRSPRELLMGGPAAKPPTTVAAVRELCDAIAKDDDVGGLLVTIRGVGCGSAVATSRRTSGRSAPSRRARFGGASSPRRSSAVAYRTARSGPPSPRKLTRLSRATPTTRGSGWT